MKDMLTIDEGAKFTGFSKGYLYKLARTKKIPHYKPMGGKIFFRESELLVFLSRNRIRPDYENMDR